MYKFSVSFSNNGKVGAYGTGAGTTYLTKDGVCTVYRNPVTGAVTSVQVFNEKEKGSK